MRSVRASAAKTVAPWIRTRNRPHHCRLAAGRRGAHCGPPTWRRVWRECNVNEKSAATATCAAALCCAKCARQTKMTPHPSLRPVSKGDMAGWGVGRTDPSSLLCRRPLARMRAPSESRMLHGPLQHGMRDVTPQACAQRHRQERITSPEAVRAPRLPPCHLKHTRGQHALATVNERGRRLKAR